MQSAEGSYARELRVGAALGNGLRRPPDHIDAEIGRLRRELRESRDREERAAASAAAARERLSQFSAASRSFASSMRVRAVERDRFKRRLAAQYSVGRALAGAGGLDEVSSKIFVILAEELGWHLGVFWKMDEGRKVLSYGGAWRAGGETPRGFEEAPRHATFARGVGLPGRVWSRGEPAWIEGMPGDSSIRGDVAAAEDLRTALAFPIRERDRVVGVFELFSRDGASPDEDLARTAALVGDQIGKFLGRRHAEEERDRLLNRRWRPGSNSKNASA